MCLAADPESGFLASGLFFLRHFSSPQVRAISAFSRLAATHERQVVDISINPFLEAERHRNPVALAADGFSLARDDLVDERSRKPIRSRPLADRQSSLREFKADFLVRRHCCLPVSNVYNCYHTLRSIP